MPINAAYTAGYAIMRVAMTFKSACNILFDQFSCDIQHKNKITMPCEALYIISERLNNKQIILQKKMTFAHQIDAKQF